MIIIDDNYKDALLSLAGAHNRQNASLVVKFLELEFGNNERYTEILSNFPGTSRRFEKIKDNLYTDYAHTPEEITATIQLAKELSDNVVVVYEPLTNRRQHYCKEHYYNTFNAVQKLYWLPSYLAREDPSQPILSPNELIKYMSSTSVAEAAEKNDTLQKHINDHLKSGHLVLLLAGGGGGSLDEWARKNFS